LQSGQTKQSFKIEKHSIFLFFGRKKPLWELWQKKGSQNVPIATLPSSAHWYRRGCCI